MDDTGIITLSIDPFVSGTAHLVVTSQFKQPYFQDIPVATLTGPYVSVNNFTVNSTLFGSTSTADIELKNIGVEISNNTTIVASTENMYITLIDNTEAYGTLAVDGTLNIQDCISFDIDPNIPDKEEVIIDIEVSDDYSKKTYYGSINFIASAPKFVINKILPTEIINPGDSKQFTFNIDNKGSAGAADIEVALTQTTSFDVSVTNPVNISEILSGANHDVNFTCDFGISIQNATTIGFNLTISNADGFLLEDSLFVAIGMTEDFESGDYNDNEWTQGGDVDWIIETDSTNTYAGLYCSRSGAIDNNQYSRMSLTFDFEENGGISFYRRVSSEGNYDYLRFFIDGIEQGQWSGVGDVWRSTSYDISPGVHELSWQYDKDGSTIGGDDCGWIDNILITNGTTGIEDQFGNLPTENKLYQNYPNPFNPVTEINFYIANSNEVRLSVFNSYGQLVKELVKEKLNKGMHTAIFNAGNLNSGIYFYTLEIDSKKLSNKMLLIK